MRRRRMTNRQSRRSFKKGNRVAGKNNYRPMRGGIRI